MQVVWEGAGRFPCQLLLFPHLCWKWELKNQSLANCSQIIQGSRGHISKCGASFPISTQAHGGTCALADAATSHTLPQQPRKAIFPRHQKSSPFHLNAFLIHFTLFFLFISFSAVSFSIWKVTWPLLPPSIFLLPLFSLGMKHRN